MQKVLFRRRKSCFRITFVIVLIPKQNRSALPVPPETLVTVTGHRLAVKSHAPGGGLSLGVPLPAPQPLPPWSTGQLQGGIGILFRDSIKMTRSPLLFHRLPASPAGPGAHLRQGNVAFSQMGTDGKAGRSIFGKLLSS